MYDNLFNIVSIDPGNNIGISIYTIDSLTYKVHSVKTHTVVLNIHVDKGPNALTERVHYLNTFFGELLEYHKPLVIVEEAAFLNNRFPKAVMQLSQYIAALDIAIYNYNRYAKVFKYPPKYVKRYIGAGGNADKDDMLKAVKKIPEINNNVKVDTITEHEVDALSIGYVFIQEMRLHPEILIK